MFPGGSFEGDTYRVNKAEAGEFWRQSFGNRFVAKFFRTKRGFVLRSGLSKVNVVFK